jgi:hypothetical protein
LNDFRNAPLEKVEGYLAAVDQYGASNLQRLQVHEAIQEIRVGFQNGVVQSTQNSLDDHKKSSDNWYHMRQQQAENMRRQGYTKDADAIDADIANSLKIREQNYKKTIEEAKAKGAKKWKEKYESRLDLEEIKLFKKTLNQYTVGAYETAEQRSTDHLAWFESNRLLNAFDVYDQNNQLAGFNFAIESAICSHGLSGTNVGQSKVDAWVKASSVERKNIYMRGFYHNQKELIDAAKQAFKDIQAAAGEVNHASEIDASVMIKATKGHL